MYANFSHLITQYSDPLCETGVGQSKVDFTNWSWDRDRPILTDFKHFYLSKTDTDFGNLNFSSDSKNTW